MEQRLSLVTLGVADLADSIRFYEALGWARAMKAADGVAFFQMGGIGLSLYPVQALCAAAGVHWRGPGGFGGVAFSPNVRPRAGVDEVVAAWTRSGRAAPPPARRQDRGGRAPPARDPP